jgi:hypothetical protein
MRGRCDLGHDFSFLETGVRKWSRTGEGPSALGRTTEVRARSRFIERSGETVIGGS